MEEFFKNITDLASNGWAGKLLFAIIVISITAVVSHLATKALKRILSREGSQLPSSSIFLNIVRVVVWVCGLSILLSSCFGFDLSAAITALGVGGIAISLGCQDTVANLVGGLQIQLARTVNPGDFIQVSGYQGIVQDVTWRYTRLLTPAGEEVIIPNAQINDSTVVQLPPQTTIKIKVSLANTIKNLPAATAKMCDAIKEQVDGVEVLADSPRVVFSEVTEFGFTTTVTVNVCEGTDYVTARNQAIIALAPFVATE